MSDNASSSNNAAAGTPPNPSSPKPRNPVERAIVWGLIAVLVGVMLFEAKQKYAYPDWLERRVKLAALEVRDLLSCAQWPVLGAQALGPRFAWLDRLPRTED